MWLLWNTKEDILKWFYFCPYNGSQQNLKQHWLSFYAPKHAGVITVKTFRTLEASQTEGSSFFFFFFFSHGSCQNFATCCNVYITKLGNVLLIKLWCCFARSTVTVFADSDHHLEKHSKRCSLSESVLVVQSKSKRSKTKKEMWSQWVFGRGWLPHKIIEDTNQQMLSKVLLAKFSFACILNCVFYILNCVVIHWQKEKCVRHCVCVRCSLKGVSVLKTQWTPWWSLQVINCEISCELMAELHLIK